MKCCSNCFKDKQIIFIIESFKQIGDCDFCENKNSYICDTEILSDEFENLVDIYSPVSSLSKSIPNENQYMLVDVLKTGWDIFNLNPNKVNDLIINLCKEIVVDQPELFNSPVTIPEINDPEFMESNSILGNTNWDDFVREIKFENRFHLNTFFNFEIFNYFLELFSVQYKKDEIFYRARLSENSVCYKNEEMGAPPKEKNSAGRANPKGIGILYLSKDVETTLYELKGRKFDYFSIGTFQLLNDIKVMSFMELDKISPFEIFNINDYAINKPFFSKISKEIGKPMRRGDSDLDYLPTQYLTEFIKSKKFDGIVYVSTINPDGFNFAAFDESNFECVDTELIEINNLKLDYSPV